ncbi:hypothetical protein ACOGYE_001929 [Edwardsiella piscicida]
MPIIIERVDVTVTFPDGEKVSGFTRLPPCPSNPLFTLYEEDGINGRIINMTKVRDIQYRVIERKAE